MKPTRQTDYGEFPPNLIVDGVQLFLQHKSQCLCVRVSRRRQHVEGSNETLVALGPLVARVEGVLHILDDASLLKLLPLLLVQGVHLTQTQTQ